jgi:hypothetical protein
LKGTNHPPRRRRIIAGDRVLAQYRDIWGLWRTGCCRLRPNNAADRGKHSIAYRGIEASHVEAQQCMVRYDVLGTPCLQGTDLTTAESDIATSRDTTPCKRRTVAAAISTGSMPFCGIEP